MQWNPMPRMEWKPTGREYAHGENLMLGRYKVAGYYWNASRPKDDPRPYRVTCVLPGIKLVQGDYETAAEAKARAEVAVNFWLTNTGLKEPTPTEE